MTASRLSRRVLDPSVVVGAAILGIAAVVAVAINGDPRLATGIALIVLVGAWSFAYPRVAIPLVIAFAALVSGLRRVATDEFGVTGAIDPLLAVVPAAAVALSFVAIRRGAARGRTRLANLIVMLTVLAVVGAANPLQGSPTVGVIGFAFFGAPLLWFWVGREFVDDALLTTVLRTIGGLAVGVAIYGLAQSQGWFPSWDQLWIENVEEDFSSLRIDGEIRPFATFTGPGELARFIALGIVAWIAGSRFSVSPLSHRILATAVVLLLGWTLLLAAVRGAVVMLALGLGAVAAARRRVPVGRALAVGVISLALLMGVANVAKAAGLTSGMIGRQVEGLATPFSSETSTVDKRFGLFTDAMSFVVTDPIGLGTGVTTPAAARLGDTRALNSEADIGDVALSWGALGLGVYVGIVALTLLSAYHLASARRDWLAFGVLGVLFAALTQWINGGLYSLAPLVWLVIGWADRSWRDHRIQQYAVSESRERVSA